MAEMVLADLYGPHHALISQWRQDAQRLDGSAEGNDPKLKAGILVAAAAFKEAADSLERILDGHDDQ